MQHLNSLNAVLPDRPTCLTIGAFDGVHRGHQRVIRRVVEMAKQANYRAAALTFHPLPRQVIGGPRPDFYLTHPDRRAALLHELGVELVITHPFDEQVRTIRAADFVDDLVQHLDLKTIWVGENFALGHRREGDLAFLRAYGEIKNFAVCTVDLNTLDSTVVSSSLIRQALRAGRVEDARRYLGRPYQLPGRVIPGDGRGRSIGFPTANTQIWEEQVCPGCGVYAANVWVGPKAYRAAVNIGLRPTLTAGDQRTVEAHLLDFEGDLYGLDLKVDFFARLRDEIKFDSLEQLIAQIQSDLAATRDLLEVQSP